MNNTLKAISQTGDELVVSNYIVLFGGMDLTGEFFTKNTKFDSNYTKSGALYVDFEHGRDAEKMGNDRDNVLGVVDWKSATIDDKGIFVKRVLNRRLDYVEAIEELIEAGLVGTSSEAISDETRKKSSGEILVWPLRRDALTVTPIEPRMVTENVLKAAKALFKAFPDSKSLSEIASRTKLPSEITNIRDFEDFLREAGFPRAAAKALAAGGWTRLDGQREVDIDAEIKALDWSFFPLKSME